MKLQEIEEIRALLPEGRTLFPYFKDKYSLQLLRYAIGRAAPVAALRQHPAAQLLQKPVVKNVLSRCGGVLKKDMLDWPDSGCLPEHYVLTLDTWGKKDGIRAAQTSRRGINMVLQLNFSNTHNREFARLLKPLAGIDPFNCAAHPVLCDKRTNRRYTLAWARLDIDWQAGEALIEELQTDWLRQAKAVRTDAERMVDRYFDRYYRDHLKADRNAFIVYYDRILLGHRSMWDEALLSAVLFFLREELGLRDIWIHTPQSGVLLKKIRYGMPPVSLYSQLPQRFCFQPVEALPQLLKNDREAIRLLRRNPGVKLNKLMF